MVRSGPSRSARNAHLSIRLGCSSAVAARRCPMTALLAFLSLLIATPDLTKEEVKRLVAAGISDDVIVEYVRSNPVQPLTAQDLIDLRQANVSEKVLAALMASARAPSQAQESGTTYT